jgi:purine nucleosidase
VELVKEAPGELTLLALGPLTTVARAMELHPLLLEQLRRIVVVGGTLQMPGNAGPVSEFHFHSDPAAARTVLRSGALVTLLPLDVTQSVVFSPADLMTWPDDTSRLARFFTQIAPFGIAATSSQYGVEGLHLEDALGVIALSQPDAVKVHSVRMDVETTGTLTRGMSVVDQRRWMLADPNVELVTSVDSVAARRRLRGVLE